MASQFNSTVFGDIKSTWNFGKEETYVETGRGLQKFTEDKNFTEYKINFDGQASWLIDRLRFQFRDRLNADVFSIKDQISRNSNYHNYAEFEGDYFVHDQTRVKGFLSYDIFEDQSFPEFSSNNFGAKIEIERKLRRNTFLSGGFEAQDLEFRNTPLDSYFQRDAYISFYRFSPQKNTFKHRRGYQTNPDPQMLKKDMFKEDTREYLNQLGLSRTASLIPIVDLGKQIDFYVPYQIQSNMTFELDAKVRYRELYNSIQRSFLEGQINGVTQFFFNSEHNLRIENHFYDRDYAQESLSDNLLHFQRNETLLSHYIAIKRFVFDHRLTVDQYFYKNQASWDSHNWIFDSAISYDIIRRWNLSYYNSWSRVNYELPRQFFTNNEHNYHSFSWRYRFSRDFSMKAIYDSESKNIKFFENSIDSSFHRKAQDYRLQYKSGNLLGFHTGYKWERERHHNFEVNDRYERMVYLGASIKL